MKKIFIIIAILGAVGAGILLLNSHECQGDRCDIASITAPTPTPTSPPTIVQQVTAGLQADGLLIDVRTTEEFIESHAKDAINLPLVDIENGTYPDAAKNLPLFLICRSGNRAGQAKTILEQAGFTNVTNVGGLSDWQSQGGEVVNN